MSDAGFGQWRSMGEAPKDGSRILVEIRASEQGPAEVDMARWAKPDRTGEACWISADSDPGLPVIYAEAELVAWMPLPAPPPRLRTVRKSDRTGGDGEPKDDETGGSGI